MYKVIDTIAYTETLFSRLPELSKYSEGLFVILDPQQINLDPRLDNQRVFVEKPDGTVEEFVATSSEERHTVVGIFFKSCLAGDIPRDSKIFWKLN